MKKSNRIFFTIIGTFEPKTYLRIPKDIIIHPNVNWDNVSGIVKIELVDASNISKRHNHMVYEELPQDLIPHYTNMYSCSYVNGFEYNIYFVDFSEDNDALTFKLAHS